MSPASPLLARLRRHLSGAGWLFVLLMMLKLAVGTACFVADGARSEAASTAGTMLVEAVQAVGQDDGASCWHDGASGCHCNCTHATPLASHALAALTALRPVHVFVAMQPTLQSPLAQNPLRPPIA